MTIASFQLCTGRQLPSVGLGLWKIDPADTAQVVQNAAECGYRHFDSACDYGNEAQAGDGLQRVMSGEGIPREELWITSKLWNTYHRAEHVRPALLKTLADLQLDYLDLYLMHFPIATQFVPFEERYPPRWITDPAVDAPMMVPDRVPLIETWRAMEELVREGLVRDIGVCNFGCSLLRDLINQADIAPAVLQIELHPYLTQEKLLRFCTESGIVVTGFSPLGAQSYFSLNMAEADEAVMEQAAIKDIARRHGRTAAQVLLRWGVQRGTSIVPKTSNVGRLKENIALFDFELTEDEMQVISGLDRGRRFNDPGDFAEAAFNTFFPIYE
ncbi:MAG: aldo/keto reductase [Pirellulales bacterium]|nr:aldo/keto reductase [Pirellulales bacterium]